MEGALIIGSLGIAPKDQMVLRALVGVLDGGISAPLRFSEHLPDCNVVFVPQHWPHRLAAHCVAVHVAEHQHAAAPELLPEFSISLPLRVSNVLAVLQSAAQRALCGAKSDDSARALPALFSLIGKGLRTSERGRTVVPLDAGQQVIIDFTMQRVYTFLPMQALLAGQYEVGTPHRISAVEEELIRCAPSHELRPLLWELAQRLAARDAAGPPRLGRYRLSRWPEAAGLSAPGHPRLAALFTHRAWTLDEACVASGTKTPAVVHWFLETCLILGLAVEEQSAVPAPAQAAPACEARSAPAALGWLGQLRKKLKLW